jgi:hypothetical protein
MFVPVGAVEDAGLELVEQVADLPGGAELAVDKRVQQAVNEVTDVDAGLVGVPADDEWFQVDRVLGTVISARGSMKALSSWAPRLTSSALKVTAYRFANRCDR